MPKEGEEYLKNTKQSFSILPTVAITKMLEGASGQ